MKIGRVLVVFLLATASSLSQALTATTTTISSSLDPSVYGQAVSFTAVVTSKLGTTPPDGEIVTFMSAGTALGTAPLSAGSATLAISTLGGGTDYVKAVYAGDSTFGGSTSSPVSQVVSPASTTTSLRSSQNPSNVGQSVTFTASVVSEFGGTIAGRVAFYNGSKSLGTAPLSGGVASLATSRLSAGTGPITATYNGSTSCSTSTSSPVSQTVGTGTFVDSSMTWDGVTRYYEVFVPTSLPANPAMLLMLHWTYPQSTFNPQALISLNWGWESFANEYSFILVKPASTWNASAKVWNWNAYFEYPAFTASESGTCDLAVQDCPDDSGFLRQLIVNLRAQYNVNPNAVYVAGISSGAQMAERVGVEISDLVAAIAPVAGQMVGQMNPPNGVPSLPGNAVAPISVQEWQGTDDEVLWPCGYGLTKYAGVTFTLDTVDDTFNYWVAQNSCSTLQTTATLCSGSTSNYENDAPTPGVSGDTGNVATGCSESNTAVQFVWEPGMGHVWNTKNLPAIWNFLSSHPKQAGQ